MKQKDVGRGISPLVRMQHPPVPSQLTAIYADSKTALQGPAEVFKILTEINSNGFPGVERESDWQTNYSSEVEANRNGAGGGHQQLHLNLEQLPYKSLFKFRGLDFIRTKTD